MMVVMLHSLRLQEQYGGEGGYEEGYGQAAGLDYGATPAVVDADFTLAAPAAEAGFDGGQAGLEYSAPAADFAAGY